MPKRGERRRDFRHDPPPAHVSHVGVREAGRHYRGSHRTVRLDPSDFTCARLVAELADEWTDLAESVELSLSTLTGYAVAVRSFGRFVDGASHQARQVSLSTDEADVPELLHSWENHLHAGYPTQSGVPRKLPERVLVLVRRRVERGLATPPRLVLRAEGSATFRRHAPGNPLDEFANRERLALRDAARDDVRALERRLDRGRALLGSGSDPHEDDGWTSLPEALRAVAHDDATVTDLKLALPAGPQDWPADLRELVAGLDLDRHHGAHKWQALLAALGRLLHPHDQDLQAFRVLLMLETGDTPEELTDLRLHDVEIDDAGAHLTTTKNRARRIRHGLHPHASGTTRGWDTAALLQRLVAATASTRTQLTDDQPLWVCAGVQAGHLTAHRADFKKYRLTHFVARHQLTVTRPHDVRRLRKTVKSIRAATVGTMHGAAGDDHTEEVFRTHYAPTATIRVLSGQAINRAQQAVFDRVAAGPILVTAAADAVAHDAPPEVRRQARAVLEATLTEADMTVTSCRDPYDSPFSAPGSLCHVRPAMCFACGNALVFDDHLPRLLLFRDHLTRLRDRLAPPVFERLWAQQWTNLQALLVQFDHEQHQQASKQIETQQLRLRLPLAMRVEFDR